MNKRAVNLCLLLITLLASNTYANNDQNCTHNIKPQKGTCYGETGEVFSWSVTNQGGKSEVLAPMMNGSISEITCDSNGLLTQAKYSSGDKFHKINGRKSWSFSSRQAPATANFCIRVFEE